MPETQSTTGPSADYDVASAIWKGMRPYQEDSLATDFHAGAPQGFAIVADGMGGHAAGDVASNLVAVHGSGHLRTVMRDMDGHPPDLPRELSAAIDQANQAIAERVRQDSKVHGMGATMLAVSLVGDRLYWGSVGDSPLFLIRDGTLRQLNQDHSMAPVIAAMVERGELTAQQGADHPDRNALTSVLMGERIEKTDVPDKPFELKQDDVLIAASDGLQFLANDRVLDLVESMRPASSAALCDALMKNLQDLGDPHQDNAAIVVIQKRLAAPLETQAKPLKDETPSEETSRPQTRILSDDDAIEDSSVADAATEKPSSESAPDSTAGAPSPDLAEASPKMDSDSASKKQGSHLPTIILVGIGVVAVAAAAIWLR